MTRTDFFVPYIQKGLSVALETPKNMFLFAIKNNPYYIYMRGYAGKYKAFTTAS